MFYFMMLSFIAGVAIVLQANINAHLGELLASSFFATFFAFLGSVLLAFPLIFLSKTYPSIDAIKSVPTYLWIIGPILGTFALTSFYYVIPKIGVLQMISYSLCGQLMFSSLSSHFGWFGMPISLITMSKFIGILTLMVSIFLINKG